MRSVSNGHRCVCGNVVAPREALCRRFTACSSRWINTGLARSRANIIQAPDPTSFSRMDHLDALLKQQQISAASLANVPQPPQTSQHQSTSALPQTEADLTYATASSFDDSPPPSKAGPKSVLRKPTGTGATSGAGTGAAAGVKKPAVAASAALRKKRELEIAGYIDTLPLEYRGSQPVRLSLPSLRRCIGEEDVFANVPGNAAGYGESHSDADGQSGGITTYVSILTATISLCDNPARISVREVRVC